MIIKVPMSLKPTALRDTENFIRDIACVTQRGVRPFIRRKKTIKEAVKHYPNPFDPFKMQFDPSFVCKDRFRRYMHIDLGYTKDSVGIAMGYVPTFLEKETLIEPDPEDTIKELKYKKVNVPLVKIDFWGKISVKKGEEIILSEVRELIYTLSKRHFYFGIISFDRFQCLHGSTKIKLLNGNVKTIEELSKEKEFWLYSWSEKHQKIVPALGRNARKTGHKVPVYKVILDNNKEIICTDTHPFLMRDGTYKQLKELIPGVSLMPFYYRDRYINQSTKKGGLYEPYRSNSNNCGSIECKKLRKKIRHQNKVNGIDKKFNNHKIKSIEFYGYEDVYDLEVDKYHNFGLEAGIFVHNSVDSIQILRNYGYTVGHFSVDRTSHILKIDAEKDNNLAKISTEGNRNSAQQALKDVLYDKRIWFPAWNEKVYDKHWLVDELGLAQEDPKSGKIDHPPGRTIDVEQAVAAVATHCVTNEFMVNISESEKQDAEIEDGFYKDRQEEIEEVLLSKNSDYDYDTEDPRNLTDYY